MAVPGHDARDYEFAKAFDLPIVEVVAGGDISREAYGVLMMVSWSIPALFPACPPKV